MALEEDVTFQAVTLHSRGLKDLTWQELQSNTPEVVVLVLFAETELLQANAHGSSAQGVSCYEHTRS